MSQNTVLGIHGSTVEKENGVDRKKLKWKNKKLISIIERYAKVVITKKFSLKFA